MKLDGIFQCVRCHGTQTNLTIAIGEGTVCVDEESCKLIRGLDAQGPADDLRVFWVLSHTQPPGAKGRVCAYEP